MERAENKEVAAQLMQALQPPTDILTQQALAILDGNVKSPNEMIAFIVERAAETREKHKIYADRIMLVERQLADMKRQAIEHRGAMMAYVEDVKALLVREKPKEVPKHDGGKQKPK
jgi:hypothetical protein